MQRGQDRDLEQYGPMAPKAILKQFHKEDYYISSRFVNGSRNRDIYLSIYMSIHLYIHRQTYLCISLSLSLSLCIYIYMYIFL